MAREELLAEWRLRLARIEQRLRDSSGTVSRGLLLIRRQVLTYLVERYGPAGREEGEGGEDLAAGPAALPSGGPDQAEAGAEPRGFWLRPPPGSGRPPKSALEIRAILSRIHQLLTRDPGSTWIMPA